jgi:hypothetical protein
LVSSRALYLRLPKLHGYNPEAALNSFESHGKLAPFTH